MCYDCKAVYYCSKSRQKRQWSEHKVLCNEISELSKRKSKNIERLGNYNTFCIPKDYNKLVNAVYKV